MTSSDIDTKPDISPEVLRTIVQMLLEQSNFFRQLAEANKREIAIIEAEISEHEDRHHILDRGEKDEQKTSSLIDFHKEWEDIEKKYKDAKGFHDTIQKNKQSLLEFISLKELNAFSIIFNNLTDKYNELNLSINTSLDSYTQLKSQFDDTTDLNIKEDLEKKLQEKAQVIRTSLQNFLLNYLELISFNPINYIYKAYSREEVEKVLSENKDKDNPSGKILANSRENVDRAKFIIYFNDYLPYYLNNKPIPAPFFTPLKQFYNDDRKTLPPDKFPEFFKLLTGIDIKAFKLANEIKIEEARNLLSKKIISNLSDKEKAQLKSELEGVEAEKKNEAQKALAYVKDSEKEEEPDKKRSLKKQATTLIKKTITTIDRATDPYLPTNPNTIKRAKQIHKIIYFELLGKGNIFSILDLARVTNIVDPRPGLPTILKQYVTGKYNKAKDKVIDKANQKLNALFDKLSINISFLRKRRKGGLLLGIASLIFNKIIAKTIGRVIKVAKTTITSIRNTKLVSNSIDFLKNNRISTGLQKFITATADLTGKPGIYIRELVTKGKLVYANILKKPFVVGIMDIGYTSKTFISKAPKGLVYGVGVSSLALSLGIPIGSIGTVFITSTLIGTGLETIDHIMHTPTTRVTGGLVRWLQEKGSALFRNPISGAFEAEKIVGKTSNVFGTTGGRMFGAMKSGLSAAMIAATIAAIFGINPWVAAGVTFGVFTTTKFLAQKIAGEQIVKYFNNSGLTRLGAIPLQKLIAHYYNQQAINNLLYDFFKTLKRGGGLGAFFQRNFLFDKDAGFLANFTILNNYLATLTYLPFYSALLSHVYGILVDINLVKSGVGVFAGLTGGWRAAFAPTAIVAGATLAALGTALLLGINIAGIGATIGAVVGGVIGFTIGTILSGGFATFITTYIGTLIGTWLGSLFDKAVDNALKGLFGIVSGISFLFSLLDILIHGNASLERIIILSMSFAMLIPTFAAITDKGAETQIQSDPTIKTETSHENTSPSSIKIINNTIYNLSSTELDKLTNLIKENYPITSTLNTYLVFSDEEESTIFANDVTLILTIDIKEYDPSLKVASLMSSLDTANYIQNTN